MARVLVVANPAAASGRTRAVAPRVLDAVRAAGFEAGTVPGEDAAAVEAALRLALRTPPAAVVAVGGDGTVHLAANALARTGVPLAIVPAGSGNDIARALGLPTDPDAAIAGLTAALASGAARPIDLVRISTGRWFVAVLSAGFDAAVNERANRLALLRGRARYLAAVALELRRLRPRRYLIRMDRDPRQVDAVLVCAGNLSTIGGGMRITPDARADDGLLDVLVATPLSRLALLKLLPQVFTGRHVADEHVSVERARVVTIDVVGRPSPVAYADGERIGPLPLTLETVPGALTVLGAPDRAPQQATSTSAG